MAVFEIILSGLVVVIALATLAQRLGVPYPVLLVLGGIALGFIPGLPPFTVDPGLLFLAFVPPLVFSAAWATSLRDFRANVRAIGPLATGLVRVTMLAVAVVTHAVLPGLTWPAAFVLGAIVSATDTVALGAIAAHAGLPRRIVTILNGESVANDPVSLVAYRLAVAAVVSGTFSIAQAGIQLVLAVIGGIAVGLAVAWLADRVQQHLHNSPVEVTLILLVPYVAFTVADRLGTSGVLAVAAAGLVLGRHDPEVRSTESRLVASDFWAVLVFVLNGLIFSLLGLELHQILTGVANRPAQILAWTAVLVIATVLLVRIIWMFLGIYLPPMIGRRRQAQRPYPLWKGALIAGWAGMRGADTLVVALALPYTTVRGAPFPDRAVIIFLTLCVIVVTLVVQGLSLPPLIARLGLPADDTVEREVATARGAAARAALARLDELEQEDRAPKEAAERVRRRRRWQAEQFAARAQGTPNRAAEGDAAAVQDMLRELVDAEQRAIVELRNQGEIGDGALRAVLRDLDLEEMRLV